MSTFASCAVLLNCSLITMLCLNMSCAPCLRSGRPLCDSQFALCVVLVLGACACTCNAVEQERILAAGVLAVSVLRPESPACLTHRLCRVLRCHVIRVLKVCGG